LQQEAAALQQSAPFVQQLDASQQGEPSKQHGDPSKQQAAPSAQHDGSEALGAVAGTVASATAIGANRATRTRQIRNRLRMV
jgi:hypothetical protein